MTDDKNSTAQSKTRARTTGLVTLAVISLLAGASVGASLEEFAAPEYAEDDWMAGVVDDATDDEDWDERKSEDSRMKTGWTTGGTTESSISSRGSQPARSSSLL